MRHYCLLLTVYGLLLLTTTYYYLLLTRSEAPSISHSDTSDIAEFALKPGVGGSGSSRRSYQSTNQSINECPPRQASDEACRTQTKILSHDQQSVLSERTRTLGHFSGMHRLWNVECWLARWLRQLKASTAMDVSISYSYFCMVRGLEKLGFVDQTGLERDCRLCC